MRAVTWALPGGTAAVRLGPIDTVLLDDRLSPRERDVAGILAAHETRPFVMIAYSEVWQTTMEAPSRSDAAGARDAPTSAPTPLSQARSSHRS